MSYRPVRDFFRRRQRCYFIKICTLAHDFTFFWSRSRYMYCLIPNKRYIVSATEFRNVRLLYCVRSWLVDRRFYNNISLHTGSRYLCLKRKICWIHDAYDRTIIICVTQYNILCYISVLCYECIVPHLFFKSCLFVKYTLQHIIITIPRVEWGILPI